MWNRKDLKTKAKEVLKLNYWKAFLVSMIIAFGGGSGGTNFNWNTQNGSVQSQSNFDKIPWMSGDIWPIIFVVIGILITLMVIAFFIFLLFPLEVGGRKYFIKATQMEFDMNYLGYSFCKNNYMDIVKAMLWRLFLNILWFFLFIIPGIVKYYAYRMVPYILADNPNIGYKRAVKLSTQMTKGHKFRIFILDISFIGLLTLGTLALFIGVLFVLPYINATKAELYMVLRRNAIESGMCNNEELLLINN